MLLKRLTNALRQQNWFSVFIELLIVIFGILIAIQLDNWNQQRQDLAQAVHWRTAIINDLTATHSQIGYRKIYYQQALDFAEMALVGLESIQPVNAEQGWQIVLGAFQAGQLWALKVTGPTYREVQAAGKMNLIGDKKTLTQLTDFYDITTNDFEMIAGFRPPYREMIREKLAWPIQKYIWQSDCQTVAKNELGGGFIFTLQPCDKPDLDSLIIESVSQLRDDVELQNKLRGRMSQLKILVEVLGRDQVHIDRVITELQKEN